MPSLVNTVVVGLVSFFLLLTGLWFAMGGGAEGGPPSSGATTVAWGDEGRHLHVETLVKNPGPSEVEAVQAHYRASVGGLQVATGDVPLEQTLGSGEEIVAFEVPLPDDVAATWWTAYAAAGERSGLKVSGHLLLMRGDAMEEVPFEWASSFRGDLGRLLDETETSCPEDEAVCVAGVEGGWDGGMLAVVLDLEATEASPALVTEGQAVLYWGDVVVARGQVPEALVDQGGRETVGVRFVFDDEGLVKWWEGHAEACESSPVRLEVAVSVETFVLDGDGDERDERRRGHRDETEVREVSWSLAAPDFETRLACGQT